MHMAKDERLPSLWVRDLVSDVIESPRCVQHPNLSIVMMDSGSARLGTQIDW